MESGAVAMPSVLLGLSYNNYINIRMTKGDKEKQKINYIMIGHSKVFEEDLIGCYINLVTKNYNFFQY